MNNILKIVLLLSVVTFNINSMSESKEKEDLSSALVQKITGYRQECLSQHLIDDLARLVQEYDPIEDKWECKELLARELGGFEVVDSLCKLDDNKIAAVSNNGYIKIWDLGTYNCISTKFLGNRIDTLCSPSKNILISGHSFHKKTINIWNLDFLDLVKKDWLYCRHERTFEFNDIGKCILCILNSDKLVFSFHENKPYNYLYKQDSIKIFNLKTGKCEQTLSEHESSITAFCAISENSLASASHDGTIKIWNLNNNECVKTLKDHNSSIHTLCILSKNKLVSGYDDCKIKIWNLETGECEKTLETDAKHLCVLSTKIVVSISGYYDKTIKIWDTESGKCIKTFQAHESGLTSLCALSENTFASGSYDGKIKIWSNQAYSNPPTEPGIVKINPSTELNRILNDALDEYDKN